MPPRTAAAKAPADPIAALATKLKAVAEAIPFVEKRGVNKAHDYNFAQAVDVVRDVRAQLYAQGVILVPGATNARHEQIGTTRNGASIYLTTVDLTYRFVDTETGAEFVIPWVGTGTDTGGDKGAYKAYTGGLKHALLTTFLLPTSDDPEHDALTPASAPPEETPAPAPTSPAAEPTKTEKDADRPAAPRIPLDRARLIAEKAVEAGLADMGGKDGALQMGLPLKAHLQTLGVTKIGLLNVDQAEATEAFIASEATAGEEA